MTTGEARLCLRCHKYRPVASNGIERRHQVADKREVILVRTFMHVYRVEVPEANIDRLLDIREEAMAEAQRLCPSLIGAELVELSDGTWLDILTWDREDGFDMLMAQADQFSLVSDMHGLLGEGPAPDVGTVRHSVRS